MATQYLIVEGGASLPEGMVLAHTLHGEPANQSMPAHAAPHGAALVMPVGDDGIAYVEPVEPVERPAGRDKRCAAKDDTCMGWSINGSEFCSAHAGVWRNPLGRKAWDPKFAEDDPEPQVP